MIVPPNSGPGEQQPVGDPKEVVSEQIRSDIARMPPELRYVDIGGKIVDIATIIEREFLRNPRVTAEMLEGFRAAPWLASDANRVRTSRMHPTIQNTPAHRLAVSIVVAMCGDNADPCAKAREISAGVPELGLRGTTWFQWTGDIPKQHQHIYGTALHDITDILVHSYGQSEGLNEAVFGAEGKITSAVLSQFVSPVVQSCQVDCWDDVRRTQDAIFEAARADLEALHPKPPELDPTDLLLPKYMPRDGSYVAPTQRYGLEPPRIMSAADLSSLKKDGSED